MSSNPTNTAHIVAGAKESSDKKSTWRGIGAQEIFLFLKIAESRDTAENILTGT